MARRWCAPDLPDWSCRVCQINSHLSYSIMSNNSINAHDGRPNNHWRRGSWIRGGFSRWTSFNKFFLNNVDKGLIWGRFLLSSSRPVSFRVIWSALYLCLSVLSCAFCLLVSYSNFEVMLALVHAITFIKRCIKTPLPLYLFCFLFFIITGDF